VTISSMKRCLDAKRITEKLAVLSDELFTDPRRARIGQRAQQVDRSLVLYFQIGIAWVGI
jgi:hypothetical protein